MFKKILNSISGNIQERASSPLLGSYTIIALAVNWKAIVILFTSKLTGSELVNEITAVIPDIKVSLGYPIVAAITISLIYPTLKALISTLNTSSLILEVKAESRLAKLKERLRRETDPIDNLINHLTESDYYAEITTEKLNKLLSLLPEVETNLKNT